VSVAAHSMIENGRLEGLTVRTIRRALIPLDVPLDWDGGWRRPELARLRDADHSALADAWARWLESNGWLARPEISFNRYGDRGRIDLLAYHPIARVLLVIEVKTALVDVQELLGTLHVKSRVARFAAGELGWHPISVVPCLLVADASTARRRIHEHDALFARFSLRGHAAVSWLRQPTGRPEGILLFRKLPDSNSSGITRVGRQRIRLRRSESSVSAVALAASAGTKTALTTAQVKSGHDRPKSDR
jgi:hypothetical protein